MWIITITQKIRSLKIIGSNYLNNLKWIVQRLWYFIRIIMPEGEIDTLSIKTEKNNLIKFLMIKERISLKQIRTKMWIIQC